MLHARSSLFLFLFLFVRPLWADAGGIWYLQATQAGLLKEPKLDSAVELKISRGDDVKEIAREGQWVRVEKNGKQGWISKFYLSSFKPVGKAKLLEDLAENEERASRRRPTNQAVAAATRGGFEEDRVRGDREMYRSDYEALEKLEMQLQKTEPLDQFRKDAHLME